MRDTFPDVGVVRIDLEFSEFQPPPSSQAHSMYPAARAFFRFACPCADCDGEFDLEGIVTKLVKGGAAAKGTKGRSASGHSHCPGTHWRDSSHSETCRIEMNYRVVVDFAA